MAKRKKVAKKKAGAAKTTAKKKNAARVLSKREAKRALERVTEQIRVLKRDVDKNFWAIGKKLDTADTLGLHQAAGYGSIADYAAAELGIGRSQAFAYMRVAASFSESIATAVGVEKLERGLRYIAKTKEEESPDDLLELRIPVPSERGEAERKRFVDCTVADLQDALSAMAAKRAPIPQRIREDVAAANETLDETVGPEAARAAMVEVRPDRARRALIDVRGIPYERARRALAALAREFPARP